MAEALRAVGEGGVGPPGHPESTQLLEGGLYRDHIRILIKGYSVVYEEC